MKNVIYNDINEAVFCEIELLRKELKKNKNIVKGYDFGKNKIIEKPISQIALNAAKNKKYCRLLYRIVKWKNPKTSIEIGTSLGLSTLYISKAIEPKSKLFTLEGNKSIAEIAFSNLKKLNATNTEIIQGNFDDTIKPLIDKITEIDLVFFDGNHHYQPTINYFEICLQKASPNAIFVFDDINWSADMQKAWRTIKSHHLVNLTLDLYFFGIVFLGDRITKENFVVRF
ncbi:MAG: class I SAM-dependent methyltransferase [Bacteroidetes bacterium]|nr:class I SAM-dependent methyltransferase [Bacteroidota bacterium]